MSQQRNRETFERAKQSIAQCQGAYGALHRQTLVFRNVHGAPDVWHVGHVRAHAVDQGAPSRQRELFEYKDYIYENTTLTFTETEAWLSALILNGQWSFGNRQLSFPEPMRFDSSYETRRRDIPVTYPCQWIRAEGSNSGYANGALLGRKQPAYPTVQMLVNHKFGIPEAEQGWYGKINIFLPSYGARLQAVKSAGLKLTVTLEGTPKKEYLIQMWCRHASGQAFEEQPFTSQAVTFRLPRNPQNVAIFLVDENAGLVDQWGDWYTELPSKKKDTPATWQTRILQGEGQEVEFKNYANPKSGAVKSQANYVDRDELAKHLAGFANTNTGHILIGVTDDGTIRGVEDMKAMKALVTELAYNNCNPALTPKLFTIAFRQSTVLGVTIERSTKLHLVRHVAYIRRSASTRPAQPHEYDQIRNPSPIHPLMPRLF